MSGYVHHWYKTLLVYMCMNVTEIQGAVPELVFMNTTDSPISFEGCVGGNGSKEVNIPAAENVTWFEAKYGCEHLGYNSMRSAASKYVWNAIRDVLAKNGYLENQTFWIGRFRPYFHTESWLDIRCQAAKENLPVLNPFHQCAVVHWESTEGNHVIIPESCDVKFPYVCQKHVGLKHFDVYEGYIIHDLPKVIKQRSTSAVNISECAFACMDRQSCSSFLYDDSMTSCTVNAYRNGIGSVMFTIAFVGGSGMLGFKRGCNITVTNGPVHVPYNTASFELPSCGYSQIPDNYCPVKEIQRSDEEFESIIQNLAQNLTVPVNSTSKYKRRLISAPDTRNSSVSMGVVGLVIIISALSLPLCVDVFGILKKQRTIVFRST